MINLRRFTTNLGLLKFFVSSLIIWHIAAIIAAPAPKSKFFDSIYDIVGPYVKILHLYNGWAYFAPSPKMNGIVSYKITNDKGEVHEFCPVDNLRRSSSSYFRKIRMYDNMAYDADYYAEALAEYYFKKHEDLKPASVEINISHQKRISPDDFLRDPACQRETVHYKTYSITSRG